MHSCATPGLVMWSSRSWTPLELDYSFTSLVPRGTEHNATKAIAKPRSGPESLQFLLFPAARSTLTPHPPRAARARHARMRHARQQIFYFLLACLLLYRGRSRYPHRQCHRRLRTLHAHARASMTVLKYEGRIGYCSSVSTALAPHGRARTTGMEPSGDRWGVGWWG